MWAVLAAFGVHLLVLFGISFSLPEPPPRQPVFSLRLAAVEQAGGAPGDAAGGALPPVPPQPSAVEPVEQSGNVSALSARSADWSVDRMPLLQTAAQLTPLPSPSSDGLIQTGPRTALLPETFEQPASSTSRAREPKPDDRATLAGQYAERWRLRVQTLARTHYPEAVRRRGLIGRLTLDVGVRADGSLHSVDLLRSSGHPLLDSAARRIVMLAAPFEPFPEPLRRRYDILHIVRTWEFDRGNRLRSTD